MIYTNPHCYAQYINKSGHIKVKELDRQVEEKEIIYTLTGVQEEFFVLGVYDGNQRVLGLTFATVQNLDMIAFLNSDFQSVDALPEMAFLPANSELSIVKDTNLYDINFNPLPSDGNAVQYTNEYLYFAQILKHRFPESNYAIYPIVYVGEAIPYSLTQLYYIKKSGSGVCTAMMDTMNGLDQFKVYDNSYYFVSYLDYDEVGLLGTFQGYKVEFADQVNVSLGGE